MYRVLLESNSRGVYELNKPDDIGETLTKIENKILQTAINDSKNRLWVLEWKKKRRSERVGQKEKRMSRLDWGIY